MPSLLLSLVLVAFAYAAPPFVPVPLSQVCVDGVNNVIQAEDVTSQGPLDIHAEGLVVQTYDANGNPSCHDGRASVAFPGQLKLVKGKVVVSASNANMKSADMKLTLIKHSAFIGTVCDDGVSLKKEVPQEYCHHHIYPELNDHLISMLSTTGSYDLEEIEKEAHQGHIIKLPQVGFGLNMLLKGDWKAELSLVLGEKRVAHIRAPSNTQWLYLA